MKGHLRERSPGRWAIIIDVPDPATGKRRRKWHAFRGNKREAQRECARLISEIGQGSYVERSKMPVAGFVHSRIDQWEAAGDITARSAQRYRLLANRQIVPHLGFKALQKLTRLDIEGWHTTLRNTGLAARTIGLRIACWARRCPMRRGMASWLKNVCKIQRAPKVSAREGIVKDMPGLIEKLHGSRLNPRHDRTVHRHAAWRDTGAAVEPVDLERGASRCAKRWRRPRLTASGSSQRRPGWAARHHPPDHRDRDATGAPPGADGDALKAGAG